MLRLTGDNLLALGQPLNGLGTIGTPTDAPTDAARLISTAIGLLTVIAAVYFMFNLLTGGISIISAGGDKGAYEEARRKITSGLIGLVITISAIFVVGLLGIIFGFNILDFATTIRGL